MKRSTHLRLTLMAATLPAALAGCDSGPETGAVVQSVDECVSAQHLSRQECQTAYDNAVAQHQKVAPRFQNWGDCNQQFGSCAPLRDNGVDYYIPPMAGFLVGYALGRRNDHYYYGYGGSLPLYRDRSGGFYKPGGDYVSGRSGAVKGAVGRPTPPARAVTVSRSGFGSSSAARSSFGGGRGFGG